METIHLKEIKAICNSERGIKIRNHFKDRRERLTMKLLLCLNCNDIFNLSNKKKNCSCGTTGGHYQDDLNAIYWGFHAVPLGFDNSSLRKALLSQPSFGDGKRFDAFVIPKRCATMKKTGGR